MEDGRSRMEDRGSRRPFRSSILHLLFSILALFSIAAEETKTRAESFVDIKGTTHYPLDFKDAKAVVLLFTCVDCPIANYYSSEINAIVKDFAGKPVRFYLVHPDPDLTAAEAVKHADTYKLTAPVLIDAKHRLVKATGATITPEAAIMLPDGSIAYRGRIDDIYPELGRRRAAPNRRDLRDAISAVLAGQPVKESRTKAVGCYIPDLR
jgi:peroxiredoxin